MKAPTLFSLIVSFAAPLFSVILMMLGSAFFTTFLSVYLDVQGYSRGEIGYIQSAYFCGMLVGAFRMEKIIKRVGHIQALAVFGSLATSATLLLLILENIYVWMALRFALGLSLAAIYIVIESWMLHNSKLKSRGVVLSLYMMSLYASQAVSQQFLSFIQIDSYTPFVVSAVFTSLSVIPVGLSSKRITLAPEVETLGVLKVSKTTPFGVAGCVAAGLLLSALYSFVPLYAVSKGITAANMMSVAIAGGVLLQWPIGKLSDIFERRRTLLSIVVVTFLLNVLIFTYTGIDQRVIYLLMFFLGGFSFTLYPISITHVCDHLDHSQITAATAIMLIFYGVGSVFGPIVSSAIIEAEGIRALFIYFMVLLGILGLVGTFSTITRPHVPLDEQTDFVPLTSNTPIAYEMDPRSEDVA